SLADRPAPPPSTALARILRGTAAPGAGAVPTKSRQRLREPRAGSNRPRTEGVQSATAPHRKRSIRVPAVAAALAAVLVVVVIAAGSGGLLPGPTQDLVANVVRTVTPFDLAEQTGPEAVLPKAPSPEAMPTPTASIPPPVGGSGSARSGDSAPNGTSSVGRDGSDSRTQPSGPDAVPTPGTLAPRPAPNVPGANAPTQGISTSSAPPAQPSQRGFRADLRGATGAQTAADGDGEGTAVLDAKPGKNELCLTLVVSGIAPVTSAHVHGGSVGARGPVVAAFTETQSTDGTPANCVTVSDELIKKIRKDPSRYYLDVHTSEFPNGALAGQLTK
ncbi:MAG: CHRD domain-containing protein, partial [Actinobacteria bacterium]|nr:CHRD domain-containing protein [Actinomycetota bacterium]